MAKRAPDEEHDHDILAAKTLGNIARHTSSPPKDDAPPSPKEVRDAQIVVLPKKPEHKHASKQAASLPERMTKVIRYQATPSEEETFMGLIEDLNEAIGRDKKPAVTVSNLHRAFVVLALHVQDELKEELAKLGLKRPMNERAAILKHEQQVAEAIHLALKKAKAYKDTL